MQPKGAMWATLVDLLTQVWQNAASRFGRQPSNMCHPNFVTRVYVWPEYAEQGCFVEFTSSSRNECLRQYHVCMCILCTLFGRQWLPCFHHCDPASFMPALLTLESCSTNFKIHDDFGCICSTSTVSYFLCLVDLADQRLVGTDLNGTLTSIFWTTIDSPRLFTNRGLSRPSSPCSAIVGS